MPEPVHCPHCGGSQVRVAQPDPRADVVAEAPPALATAGHQDNGEFYLLGIVFALGGLLALGHALGDVAGQAWSALADTLVPSRCGFGPLGLLGLSLLLAGARDGRRTPVSASAAPRREPVAGARGPLAPQELYECASCGLRFPGLPPPATRRGLVVPVEGAGRAAGKRADCGRPPAGLFH